MTRTRSLPLTAACNKYSRPLLYIKHTNSSELIAACYILQAYAVRPVDDIHLLIGLRFSSSGSQAHGRIQHCVLAEYHCLQLMYPVYHQQALISLTKLRTHRHSRQEARAQSCLGQIVRFRAPSSKESTKVPLMMLVSVTACSIPTFPGCISR